MATKRLKKHVHRGMKRRLMGCKTSKKGLYKAVGKKEKNVGTLDLAKAENVKK